MGRRGERRASRVACGWRVWSVVRGWCGCVGVTWAGVAAHGGAVGGARGPATSGRRGLSARVCHLGNFVRGEDHDRECNSCL